MCAKNLLKSAIARAARSSKSLPTKAVISPIKLISTRFVIVVIWGGGVVGCSPGRKNTRTKACLKSRIGTHYSGVAWGRENFAGKHASSLSQQSEFGLKLYQARRHIDCERERDRGARRARHEANTCRNDDGADACGGRSGTSNQLASSIGWLPRVAPANGTTAAGGPKFVSHRALRGGGAPRCLDRSGALNIADAVRTSISHNP